MRTEPVAAVINAFAIIEMLADQQCLGVGEICKALGGSKTTAHRLLQSLIEVGMVTQDPETKRYKLTYRLFELGAKISGSADLVQAAHGPMTWLNERTGETVHLGVMDANALIYLHKLDSKHALRLVSRVGKIAPLHSTALGKVLLAWQEQALIETITAQLSYDIRTPNTIIDIEHFRRQLRQVKQQGYALDEEENEQDIVCFAVPVFNLSGQPVAGLSVSIPTFRLAPEQRAPLIALLQQAGQELSAQLGYRPLA